MCKHRESLSNCFTLSLWFTAKIHKTNKVGIIRNDSYNSNFVNFDVSEIYTDKIVAKFQLSDFNKYKGHFEFTPTLSVCDKLVVLELKRKDV